MKTAYKGIILFVLLVLIGVFLLAASLFLPKGVIHNNVYFSVDTFNNEMDLPRSIPDYPMSMLDNNTDAWMLLIADYHASDGSLADQLFLGQYAVYDENKSGLVGMDSIGSLQAEEVLRVGEYPRYWHGWLFPLRLSLCLFNYSGIRMMNVVILTVLFAITVMSIERTKQRETLIPFLISFAILMPAALPLCMAYMISTCIALIASALILQYRERIDALIGIRLYFMLIGAITAYSEFLQFPLITLGFPLVFLLAVRGKAQSSKRDIMDTFLCVFAWGCGYFGMWAAKWLLASLFTSRNVIKDATHQISIRFSSTGDGQTNMTISRLDAVIRNLEVLNRRPVILMLLSSTVFYTIRLICLQVLPEPNEKKTIAIQRIAPFLLLSLLPFVWILLLANHSYIHFHFTYRVFSVTVFAFLSGLSILSMHARETRVINGGMLETPIRKNGSQYD